jgi:hypothetical protein
VEVFLQSGNYSFTLWFVRTWNIFWSYVNSFATSLFCRSQVVLSDDCWSILNWRRLCKSHRVSLCNALFSPVFSHMASWSLRLASHLLLLYSEGLPRFTWFILKLYFGNALQSISQGNHNVDFIYFPSLKNHCPERRDKGEWWREWIQLWYIIRIFVNVTVYLQYNNKNFTKGLVEWLKW